MTNLIAKDLPYVCIPLVTAAADSDHPSSVSDKDLRKLGQIKNLVLALEAFLPADLCSTRELVGAHIRVYISPSPTSPANMGIGEVHNICLELLTALERAAADIKNNAERPRPLAMDVIVPNKKTVALLSALASTNTESTHPVKLASQDGDRSFPALSMDTFTAAGDDVVRRKTGTFRLVLLERGDRAGTHRFGFPGGAKALVPNTPKWQWREIRNVLSSETMLSGTLLRPSGTGEWTIDDDASLTAQKDMFTPEGE